jgi:hypothetical protein
MRPTEKLAVSTLVILILVMVATAWSGGFSGGHRDVWGPRFEATLPVPEAIRHRGLADTIDPLGRIRYWNAIALDANALDHTPVPAGETRVFGEQYGPCRTSRAFAIIHIAIFDAVNAIDGGFRSYTGIPHAHAPASMDAAIARAAHDTLVALYPSQAETFSELLADDLNRIPDGTKKDNGIKTGARAARAILKLRTDDGSDYIELLVGSGFITSDLPGKWRQDPISEIPLALGAYWGKVRPFVMHSPGQFPVPPPPSLMSRKYAAAFNEVKNFGGDGIGTPTDRTADQTIAGTYWAYDGTPGLGTPPRLYNQIAVHIAEQRGSNAIQLARLLALVNVAQADAAILCWKYKYYYQYWRPVVGIREANPGTGPTGLGDGNPDTIGDPDFSPLGAPSSNQSGPNFTPPFPAYPSGHATFGGVLFQILRRFYGTDDISFTFVSDEFNGVTTDNEGNVRPLIPRTFSSLSEAEEENGQSRIYLGLHWAFDKNTGIAKGNQMADYVINRAFVPRRLPWRSGSLPPSPYSLSCQPCPLDR